MDVYPSSKVFTRRADPFNKVCILLRKGLLSPPPPIHPRFFFGIFPIFTLSSLLTFCPIKGSYGGEPMGQQQAIVLTKLDNGKEIKVRCGEVIQIELKTMGAAGYAWHIENLDGEYLELLPKETRRISPEGMVGAPELSVWHFKTRKRGHTEIKMAQYRTWEGFKKSIDSFSVKLEIE